MGKQEAEGQTTIGTTDPTVYADTLQGTHTEQNSCPPCFFNYLDSFDFFSNPKYHPSLDNPTNNRTYTAGILGYSGQQPSDTHTTTTARTPTPAYQGANPIGVGSLTVLSSTDPQYFGGVRTEARLQDRSLGNFSNTAGSSNSGNRSPS